MDELTDAQLAALRSSLTEIRGELERLIELTREATKPVDLSEPIGRLTRMDALQQQGITKANRRSHELRLQQVVQALNSFDDGRFGICRRCDDPIGIRRLEARPESPYCLECQDEIDSKHG